MLKSNVLFTIHNNLTQEADLMALSITQNFECSASSSPQCLTLSHRFYVSNFGFIPDGIVFISTHEFGSFIQIDESNIKDIKLNGYLFVFKQNKIRNILLREGEFLEIFFINPIKHGTEIISNIKFLHITPTRQFVQES